MAARQLAGRAEKWLVAVVALLGVNIHAIARWPVASAQPDPVVAPVAACDVAILQALTPPGIDVTLGTAVELTDPDRCRVDGVIVPGEPFSAVPIGFQVSLPEFFNGRFLLEAQGGSGGPPIPDPRIGRLARGFAIATTDRGNAPLHGLDFSWENDVGQNANWSNRASHLTAVVGQALTRGYYGVNSLNRYIVGCSGGGHAGLSTMRVNATEDFDGVVVGAAPTVGSSQVFNWARILQHISLNPDGWIPPALMEAAEQAIVATYDGIDGAEDGIIQDDRLFQLDEHLLHNVGFSEAQIETFNLIRSPLVYHGSDVPVPLGGYSINRVGDWGVWLSGLVPPPWSLAQGSEAPLGFLVVDSNYRARVGPGFDFVTDLDVDDPADHTLLANPFDGSIEGPFDLREFRDGGGKLLRYHGQEDPAISPRESVVAYKEMGKFEPNPNTLKNWAQVYMVPGLGHCSGGPGPDDVQDQLLDAMIKWVEHNKKPKSIIATTSDGSRSFLLCPEQQIASYVKMGDLDDAANWKCRKHPNP